MPVVLHTQKLSRSTFVPAGVVDRLGQEYVDSEIINGLKIKLEKKRNTSIGFFVD